MGLATHIHSLFLWQFAVASVSYFLGFSVTVSATEKKAGEEFREQVLWGAAEGSGFV